MSKKLMSLILLTAMNLRLSITAITPLFDLIQQEFHVSNTLTALLVTIPLICFAIGALITPFLIQRLGSLPLLLITNSLIILANLWRPTGILALIVGTIILGSAIAVLNVLIPTMITTATANKEQITQITSYYSLTMNLVAGIGTALVLPLALICGWHVTLQWLALPALAALLGSLLFHNELSRWPISATRVVNNKFHLNKTTVYLAVFMGMQSLIFYSLITWLPTIYQSFGTSATEAGTLLSVFQFIGIPATLVLTRWQNYRHLLWLSLLGYFAGISLIAEVGIGQWLSALILGFTCSLIFTIALNLVTTSSQQPTIVARRSAITQSFGYLLSAFGPLLLGQLNDYFKNWFLVIVVIISLMLLTVVIGLRLLHHQQLISIYKK